jgi:hypothetical protein
MARYILKISNLTLIESKYKKTCLIPYLKSLNIIGVMMKFGKIGAKKILKIRH